MSYGEDCYAGVEAQRDAESARQYARELEQRLNEMQRDHAAETRELRDEITELRKEVREDISTLWARLNEVQASV